MSVTSSSRGGHFKGTQVEELEQRSQQQNPQGALNCCCLLPLKQSQHGSSDGGVGGQRMSCKEQILLKPQAIVSPFRGSDFFGVIKTLLTHSL